MPPLRAYQIAKLGDVHNTRPDKCCGVDAQSKSILEDDIKVNNLQSKLAILDQTGKISHTLAGP